MLKMSGLNLTKSPFPPAWNCGAKYAVSFPVYWKKELIVVTTETLTAIALFYMPIVTGLVKLIDTGIPKTVVVMLKGWALIAFDKVLIT